MAQDKDLTDQYMTASQEGKMTRTVWLRDFETPLYFLTFVGRLNDAQELFPVFFPSCRRKGKVLLNTLADMVMKCSKSITLFICSMPIDASFI